MRTALIDRSTISGNEALQTGGGIYNAADSVLAITASTIASNQAGLNGGGIYDSSTETNPVTISGTIVADNDLIEPTGEEYLYRDVTAGIVSGGHNLIGETIVQTIPNYIIELYGADILVAWSEVPQFQPLATDIVNVDARLAPLADNGGPTMTHALLADSPAINAGILAAEESYDQRGVTRGLFHDIGAYEAGNVPGVAVQPRYGASDNPLDLVFFGTDEDDHIRVQLGDVIEVTINGHTWRYDTNSKFSYPGIEYSRITRLLFNGLGGNDEVEVIGTANDDQMTLYSNWNDLINEYQNLGFTNVEECSIHGGGGNDKLWLFGTQHADIFVMQPKWGSAHLVDEANAGTKPSRIRYLQFESTIVFTNVDDFVTLLGSDGDDTLTTNTIAPEYPLGVGYATFAPSGRAALLTGPGYENAVYGRAELMALPGTGGHDIAILNDQYSVSHLPVPLISVTNPDGTISLVPDPSASSYEPDSQFYIRQGEIKYTGWGMTHRVNGFYDVTVNAGGGDDNVYVLGSVGDDKFSYEDGVGRLRTTIGYSVNIFDAETIDVHTNGGNDIACLYDTDGDDTFVSTANDARMFGADGSKVIVHGYNTAYAYSENGGYDTALFYDSPENDTFVANPFNVRMERTGFYHNARNFDKAIGYAWNGGYDTAYLHDSAGNDTFVASPNRARMEGDNYGSYTYGFEKNLGFALSGGVDTAYLHDSAGDDAFVAHPHHSRLTGDGFYNSAQSFEMVTGFSLTGGNDTATLHDSAGDDSFTVKPAQSTMTGNGYRNSARDFESTTGLAINGGIDAATFYDTAGDDDFISSPTVARMNTGGIKREAKNFELVNAYATAGGNDNAYLYGSPSGNSFYSNPGYNRFDTATSEVRSYGFEQTIAFGSIGNDVASFYDVRDGDYALGRDDSFLLRRSDGTISRVVDFDSKDDRVLLLILRENNPVLDVDTESIDYVFEDFHKFDTGIGRPLPPIRILTI